MNDTRCEASKAPNKDIDDAVTTGGKVGIGVGSGCKSMSGLIVKYFLRLAVHSLSFLILIFSFFR